MDQIMDKKELKKKMLEESIKKHQTVINDFSTRISELKEEEENLEYESYNSMARRPYNEQVMPEVEAINRQLQFANEEMDLLYKLQNSEDVMRNEVNLGAAVETDKGTFFVSASIEQFNVDGEEMMGLSTKSPLFQAMSGKKKGDTFSHNDITYKIRDVF